MSFKVCPGAIVGIAAEKDLVDGSAIAAGDVLIGLPSVGLHTNGYSLARRILFDEMGLKVDDPFPTGTRTVGEELLQPHPYYGPAVLAARAAGAVRGMAHITGGGIPGNLVRVLPDGLRAEVKRGSWPVPDSFRLLCDAGHVSEGEAYEVWNMGVGMVLVVKREDAPAIARAVEAGGRAPYRIGEIVSGPREVALTA